VPYPLAKGSEKKMEKQNAKDKSLDDLKKIAEFLVSEIEKDCLVRLGKNKTERDSFFSQITGNTHEILLTQTKSAFQQSHEDIIKSIEKW